MPGITPRLPLNLAPSDGYDLVKTMPEVIRQNLKNLLLTNPGERIMDPHFGVGIKRFLFEQNITSTHKTIKTIISKQIKKYMPFLDLQDTEIIQDNEDGNAMYITISYLISPLNQRDLVNLHIRR
jgi:uncharacterized protein